MLKFSEIAGDWPSPPEDPFRNRSLGEGDCPCYARIFYQVVGGDSTSSILRFLARIYIDNPDGKDLYHCALEVQCPDDEGCGRWIIELTDHVDGEEATEKGQILEGDAGSIGSSSPGFEYGIRKWRDGEVNDGGPDHGGKDPYVAIRGDCEKIKEILERAGTIPTNDYTSDWTSNSAVFWLLERAGYDTSGIPELSDGLTPNRSNGARLGNEARQQAGP